jgi:3-hydroxybutyryl-CoA dehydrogenase
VTLIDPGSGRPASPNSDRAADLASLLAAAGISVTRNPADPTDLALVAIGPEGGVLGPASAAGLAADAVGLHLPDKGLAELVPSGLTSAGALGTARALVARLGLTAVRSADRPGLLVGALLFAHLRDAVVMVADGYAAPGDVDTAMTLGCGYPRGPMRLLADAGPDLAVDVLSAMHAGYGDPAFAPPPLLREYALGALPAAPSGAG